MRRLWVFSLTMCIATCVTTDTPQASGTPSRLPSSSTMLLVTEPPPSTLGKSSLPSTSSLSSRETPEPSSSTAQPTLAPLVPTASALKGEASFPTGPSPSAGSNLLDAVLLPTSRTASSASPKFHTESPMLNIIYDARSSAHKHTHHNQRFGPTFETNATSITVQIGSTAYIDCKISLLQDNAVSWVLRKPSEDSLRLLTVAQTTYSGDARHAIEFLYPNNWRLIVKNVTKQDEGTYECQISTHPPKLIRTHVYINVPEVLIVDEKGRTIQDKHYETNSTIRLSCIVRHVHMTGSVVSWIHQGVLLNQDSTRGGISVKSELREDGAESVLNVARVDKADSGNYTCSISPMQRTTVLVHILDGESMAELHHGSPSAALRPRLLVTAVLLLLRAAAPR